MTLSRPESCILSMPNNPKRSRNFWIHWSWNAPILIHTGMDDLERELSTSQSTSEMITLITTEAEKYPRSKILDSTLLPRQDKHSEDMVKVNSLIEKKCSRLANVHLIDHSNLFQQNKILHDAKHLNPYGVKLFAENLKDMIYGRRQTAQHLPSSWPRRFSPRKNIRQDQDKSRSSCAAVLQGSPPLIAHPAANPTAHPAAHPAAYAAHVPAPPPAACPPPGITANPAVQQHTEQQGHMNISIRHKMFPLIQFFNSQFHNSD